MADNRFNKSTPRLQDEYFRVPASAEPYLRSPAKPQLNGLPRSRQATRGRAMGLAEPRCSKRWAVIITKVRPVSVHSQAGG